MIDEVMQVSDDYAMATARDLATMEGLMCGISSGASVWAAKLLAARPENKWPPQDPNHVLSLALPPSLMGDFCCCHARIVDGRERAALLSGMPRAAGARTSSASSRRSASATSRRRSTPTCGRRHPPRRPSRSRTECPEDSLRRYGGRLERTRGAAAPIGGRYLDGRAASSSRTDAQRASSSRGMRHTRRPG